MWIKVDYSAVNYKDGLAAQGHPGVARKLPLIPGIDAVGRVVESGDPRFSVGEPVLVAHAKFGTAHHGGWASHLCVPGDWVFPLPPGMDQKQVATYGTAGFTAAQSVEKILDQGIRPADGPVLVTGATGGVGTFAVKILAKLGYTVVACSGKSERYQWLREHGASDVISRDEVNDTGKAPLLKGRWAAAVDTVGGNALATVLKSCLPHACVTACGMVAGHELPITVYPFILRGVTLCGIDSAGITREVRQRMWNRIAEQWDFDVSTLSSEIGISELPEAVDKIIKGQSAGRTLVKF